jgi:transposase InsO family protein
VVLSRGATGCAYDNAVAESFFATIKRELITTRPWRSVTELRRAIFNYIEGWYHTRRLQLAFVPEPRPVGSSPSHPRRRGGIIELKKPVR